MVRLLFMALVFALLCARISTAQAQITEQTKLTAPDGDRLWRFGISVDMSGDTAVVGASGDDSAYVFIRGPGGSWSLQAKLVAPDGEDNDWFGLAVAVDQDTVVVSSSNHDGGRGSVYVFVRSGTVWSFQQELQDSEGAGSLGGVSNQGVDIDGDTVIAGASGYGDWTGAAFVFQRSGEIWTEQQKLLPLDGPINGAFGSNVAINGNELLVSAPSDGHAGNRSGSAYVFVRTGGIWTEQQKLVAADASADAAFGGSLAIDGDTAAVSAPEEGNFRGAAYVFERSGATWNQLQKLVPADLYEYSHFGMSAAIEGNTLLIGCAANGSYVFGRSRSTWSEDERLIASDAEPGDYFGYAVALEHGTGLVGAYVDDSMTGSAYEFTDLTVQSEAIASVSPTSVSSTPTIVNETSAPYTLTITNPGTAPLTISSMAMDGGDADQFKVERGTCPSLTPTLIAASSCTVRVKFAPTLLTPTTTKSTKLRIASNGVTVNVPLSGRTGTAQQIPTLSQWGMILLGALLALTMLTTQKRQRPN